MFTLCHHAIDTKNNEIVHYTLLLEYGKGVGGGVLSASLKGIFLDFLRVTNSIVEFQKSLLINCVLWKFYARHYWLTKQ